MSDKYDEDKFIPRDIISIYNDVCESDVISHIYKRRGDEDLAPLDMSVEELFQWSVRDHRLMMDKGEEIKDEDIKRSWAEVKTRQALIISYYEWSLHYPEQSEIRLLIKLIDSNLDLDMGDYLLLRLMDIITDPSLDTISLFTNVFMTRAHFQQINKYVEKHQCKIYIHRIAADSRDNEYYVKRSPINAKNIIPKYIQGGNKLGFD